MTFPWPCPRREAHGPHPRPVVGMSAGDGKPEQRLFENGLGLITGDPRCPGVRAHPDTMIGGVGRSRLQPRGFLVGPGKGATFVDDPVTGERRWQPTAGDPVTVIPLGPKVKPPPPLLMVPGPPPTECNGVCLMSSDLIECGSGVAHADPDCPLHGSGS